MSTKEGLKELYPALICGKDGAFWKALEKYLNTVILHTQNADDGDGLDTWKKIGMNVATRTLAKKLIKLVNNDAEAYMKTQGK